MAVFCCPVVLASKETVPTAVFDVTVVFTPNAAPPIATLLIAVVIAFKAP